MALVQGRIAQKKREQLDDLIKRGFYQSISSTVKEGIRLLLEEKHDIDLNPKNGLNEGQIISLETSLTDYVKAFGKIPDRKKIRSFLEENYSWYTESQISSAIRLYISILKAHNN